MKKSFLKTCTLIFLPFQITQLKIDYNPFAKGFRDNGMGRRYLLNLLFNKYIGKKHLSVSRVMIQIRLFYNNLKKYKRAIRIKILPAINLI